MKSRSKKIQSRRRRSRNLVRIKLSPKHKGCLKKLGYSSRDVPEVRHKSLRRAVQQYGKGNVVKKLNAICVLNKNRSPLISRTFCTDKKYVKSL